jgi:hypothetical protein
VYGWELTEWTSEQLKQEGILLQTQAIRSSEIDTVVFRPLLTFVMLLAACIRCDDIIPYVPSYHNL